MMGKSNAGSACQESLRWVQGGEESGCEYIPELPSEWAGALVGMRRVRPLQRRGCGALREAADREAAANMRWYRDICRPLSKETGGDFFSCLICNKRKERKKWEFMKN